MALMVKNPPAIVGDVRDTSSIPGWGTSPGRGGRNPLQYSCLENPMDWRTWRATIHSVTKNRTRLKQLNTHIGTHTYICNCNVYYIQLHIYTEKVMAPHSSTLAWKTPWTEGPGWLQSMGSKESDRTELLHFHFSLSCIGEGNGNLLQCSCLENSRDGGAWWAAVYGVAQSRTWLKQLSSSSTYIYFIL